MRARRGTTERWIAPGYLSIALLLVALALPTALRPPQQPPNTSAEFSPDAPPDETQDAIISALNRGTSGTAGSAATAGIATDPTAARPTATAAMPVSPPRFCPGGFGDPPRQVESFYSAPCAPAWQGDNGGATYKNVAPNEIRVGAVLASTHNGSMAIDDDEGPLIAESPIEGESDAHRTWRVYQSYFNQNFQLWGRQLRFVVAPPTSGNAYDGSELRNRVQQLDEEHRAFAVYVDDAPGLEEVARRQLVGLGGYGWRDAVYRDNQPYLASWEASGTKMMRYGSAYICNKLSGRPAAFAGGAEQGKPRKFGVLTADYGGLSGAGSGTELGEMVRRECGIDVLTQVWNSSGEFDPTTTATGIARLKSEGVTTVVLDIDVVWLAAHLSQSDTQAYFPEWVVPGTWSLDRSTTYHQSFSQTQWVHAFGLSSKVMAQLDEHQDHYRAYRSIDNTNVPADSDFAFRRLLQIVNGIQMAGPNLNPDTFRQGLHRMGRRGNDPLWSVGGGYGPGDHGYADDVAEIWWDPTATDPNNETRRGAWQYVDCGRRHRLDALPPGEPRMFDPAGTCTVAPGQA